MFKLTRYICYTAKCQSGYMKKLKTSMTPMEEIIVQGDFAKNYSYVVQDEIQIGSMLHINDRRITPFSTGTCVISDCKDHTTVTVFAFLKVVLKYLKTELPAVKKIHYFTDGCAGQYKNKNNFIHLCNHEDDFGLAAEWNFFTTSHGKSACDGLMVLGEL